MIRLRVGYHESRRCSRDTYPESCTTKYTSIRKVRLPVQSQLGLSLGGGAHMAAVLVAAKTSLFQWALVCGLRPARLGRARLGMTLEPLFWLHCSIIGTQSSAGVHMAAVLLVKKVSATRKRDKCRCLQIVRNLAHIDCVWLHECHIGATPVQGYLAHKKQRPPRTLQ